MGRRESIARVSRFWAGLLFVGSLAAFDWSPARAEGLLGAGLSLKGSVPADPSEKAAALQLGRVKVALDQSRWDEAEALLEKSGGPAALEDHLEFQRIRLFRAGDETRKWFFARRRGCCVFRRVRS